MAVENLRQFEQELRQLVIELPEKAIVPFQKKITFDLLRRIVNRTPVDTGRLRGNWQASVGSPATEEVKVTVERPERARGTGSRKFNRKLKRETRGRVQTAISQVTIAQGQAALARLTPFVDTFITNNVFYVTFVENGTEKMRARKMVASSLQEIAHLFP